MKQLLFFIVPFFAIEASAFTWHVGPSQAYTTPSQIVNLINDNDSILIDGGIYINDASKWTKSNLTFIGLGLGTNRTILQYTGNIPNGKGIFVFELPGFSDNPSIENIVFDGAQISDQDGANGAGIRFQAKNLTIKNCRFVNCQNGILEGNSSVSNSAVTISDSEFENNGYQLPNDPTHSGYEHHIYISASCSLLTIQNNYFHHPRGQANSIKTRALSNFILYNMVNEGTTGYGSYELNIAQGGLSVVMGNIFIQGPNGANHSVVGYDAATNPQQDFYFVNNTVINQFVGNVKFFNITPSLGIQTFKMFNNIFASVPGATNSYFAANTPVVLDSAKNSLSSNYLSYGFFDPINLDFRLTNTAISALNNGVFAGMTSSAYNLTPDKMYISHLLPLLPRSILGSAIDLGAYEYESSVDLSEKSASDGFIVYPNPSYEHISLHCNKRILAIKFVSSQGEIIAVETPIADDKAEIEIPSSGCYILEIIFDDGTRERKKIIRY